MLKEPVQAKDIESAYIESTLLGIQELKKNLVTQIAHNFRTPLTSVIGFAEILLDDRPLTDEQRVEYARFIQYEGIRLSKLIDDVLELSSLESGEARLQADDCVLQDVVSAAVARITDFAHGRLVKVNCDFVISPFKVRFDRDKVVEAIYQLLHNAVRFTKPNDEVTVTANVVGQTAEIAVRDSGPGIPEEDVPCLFANARRVNRMEQDPRGTGVGLAIVRRILELHHGEIRVESKKDEGSLITLRIPGS
jgi:signal transduction histidine kinase